MVSEQTYTRTIRRRIRGGKDARYPCQRLLTVAFDDATFLVMRNRAERERTSVSEQVRLLVQWGLEAGE